MRAYGVLCRLANGEQMVVTTNADTADEALEQVSAHRALFFGSGDGAGRWLASQNPRTIIEVGEARPLAEWGAPAA